MVDLEERLEKEVSRVFDDMTHLKTGSKEHHLASKTLIGLIQVIRGIDRDENIRPTLIADPPELCKEPISEPCTVTEEALDEVVPTAELCEEPTSEPCVVGKATAPWEEDAVVVEEEEYTKEAVRQMLSDASQSGIQIRAIISKYVPEGADAKFSNIPKSCYKEIVKELRNAK